MALVTRPAAGYSPSNAITNTTKYQTDSAGSVAISSTKVDGDINKAFDELTNQSNRLDDLEDPVASLTAATITASDVVSFADVSDGDALKKSTVQGILDLISSLVPTATVAPYAGSSAPSGWLFCYGQEVSQATYADLYSAIGTTYNTGGEGGGNFRLPDMRGRAVFGKDNMGGSAASRITNGTSGITGTTLGATGGDERMHQHTHTASVTDTGHTHGVHIRNGFGANTNYLVAGSGGSSGNNSTSGGSGDISSDSATTGISVANADYGSGASQNMPPAIIMNWIIKT